MGDISNVTPQPRELLNKVPGLYREAANRGMTLSHYLERHVDPSRNWTGDDAKVGAFGRVLRASGVIWKSDPSSGYYADTYGELVNDDTTRALIPEWANTVWRKARTTGYVPQIDPRFVLNTDDHVLGSAIRPYAEAANAYQVDMAPALSLADLVAMTTPIDGDAYRRIFMDTPAAADVRWARIAETSDIPRSTVKSSERATRLFKYGRAIELSYEVLRRSPIDKVGFFIAQAALQVEQDRVAQAIDTLLNGDGNAGTSAMNYNHSALDTGTALTVKGLIAFKQKFSPPYRLTHLFARESELVNLQMLQMPNSNPFLAEAQGALGFGGLTPLQDLNAGVILYGQTQAVASSVYLGIDKARALERVTEIGSDIQEVENFIERQTRLLTFTEVDGFSILDANAAKTLTLA